MPYIKKEDRRLIDKHLNKIICITKNNFTKLQDALYYIFTEHEDDKPIISDDINHPILSLEDSLCRKNKGNYNYILSRIIAAFFLENKSYSSIDKIVNLLEKMKKRSNGYFVGTIECAKLEFYRRIASPYEDIKKKENSDTIEYSEFDSLV